MKTAVVTGEEKTIAATPVRRMGRPEDIAHACAFLISEEAGYITRQILGVNAGETRKRLARRYPQTAPLAAEPTSLVYLASTPVV